jgi:hypothetical protein
LAGARVMLAGALRLGLGDERVAGLAGGWVAVAGACPAAGSTTCGLDRGGLAVAIAVADVFVVVVPAASPTDPLEPHPASAMTAVSVATWARMGRL